MEAETPLWSEIEELDHMTMKYMRTILRMDGSWEQENGQIRQKSNCAIREMFDTHNVHSLLQYRRIKWFQEMHRRPEEYVQLRAALNGRLSEEQEDTPYGTVRWVTQIVRDPQDLKECRTRMNCSIEERIRNVGTQALLSYEFAWVSNCDCAQVLNQENAGTTEEGACARPNL